MVSAIALALYKQAARECSRGEHRAAMARKNTEPKEPYVMKVAANFDPIRDMEAGILESNANLARDLSSHSGRMAGAGAIGAGTAGAVAGGTLGLALVWALMRDPSWKDYALGGLSGATLVGAPAGVLGASAGGAVPGEVVAADLQAAAHKRRYGV